MFQKISRTAANVTGVGNKAGGTFKELKHHNAKQQTLSQTRRTLGSGNLRAAVVCPDGEDKSEWIAANTVDFFNEISLLYGLCQVEASEKYTQAGEGFPPGFEYRWQVSPKDPPVRCSSPDYVDFVLYWVEDHLENEQIFPISEDIPFPSDFMSYIKDIYKRLFRIFAIVYHSHFPIYEKLGAVAHLNTCFKHFMYFCFEFDLVPENELKALKGPTDRMRAAYEKGDET
jgi:MOB kinase activator 1